MDVLTKLIVLITSQHICVANNDIVHLKLT